jgi:hypothetical protein
MHVASTKLEAKILAKAVHTAMYFESKKSP